MTIPFVYQAQIDRGDTLRDAGALEDAVTAYRQTIASAPTLALGHYKLGVTLARMGRESEAEACYREALRLAPNYPEAANNLGLILADRGEFGEAEVLFRNALTAKIDYLEAHINLADLLCKDARRTEALYLYQRAIAIDPMSALAHGQLGTLFHDIGRIADGISALKRAIDLDASHAHAWANLARCYMTWHWLDDAERCNRESIRLDPTLTGVWQNLLLSTNYRTEDRPTVFLRHLSFGEHLESVTAALAKPQHRTAADPGKRLRIGFVSGDLRRHSVSHFIEGPLTALNPGEMEAWAYYNYPTEDYRTAELKELFVEWRSIWGVSDSEVARMIAEDRIDILIDLAGPTGNARMRVFALKPAPIQVSWIGYPNTSGLKAIDYRLTDEWADPTGDSERYHAETLVRLPNCFLCYSPPKETPAVSALPSLSGKPITFGSFNTQAKIGDETLALWAKVLDAVPAARLAIKSVGGFHDPATKVDFIGQLQRAGIEPSRVTLHSPPTALADHLALYGEIDIALDTYPYHGTTTTCEALWMGVPVVTLAGDRHASRVGRSLLSNLGLQELIAADATDYVHIATDLAHNIPRLAELRATLRQRMLASPLLDAPAMAEGLAHVLRRMWRTYCEGHGADSTTSESVEESRYVVNLRGGYRIVVPADTIANATTWVMLEQEDWFEDEIDFIRKICTDAWNALDIGAGYGAYTLALAHAGAESVVAFEPDEAPRRLLRDSIVLNHFEHKIEVCTYGLSAVSVNTNVKLRPLDDVIGRVIPPDRQIDFVKLDTEYENLAIVRGGLGLFSAHSPLVLFGFKHANTTNTELAAMFRALGYEIFRHVPALDCLTRVPREMEAALDDFTLNLFACKPDRAAQLAAASHLIDAEVASDVALRPEWIEALSSLPALTRVAVESEWKAFDLASDYGKALLSWCGSRRTELACSQRFRLLAQALDHIQAAIANEDSHPAVALLAIRICSDIGMRSAAINVATSFIEQMTPDEEFPLDRPLPPAYVAFDNRRAGTSPGKFLYQSVAEFVLDRGSHSLFFRDTPAALIVNALGNPEHSARLERSAVLVAMRKGATPQLDSSAKLFQGTAENLNPALWRTLVKKLALKARNGQQALSPEFSQALALFRAGKATEALACAEAALLQEPSAPLLNIAANSAKALGNTEKAEALWRTAIAVQPDYAEAHNDLGILLMEAKRFDLAEDAYRRALEIRPDYADAYNNLGILLTEMLRFDDAENAYRHLLELRPGNAEAYANLGVLLKNMKRFGEAETAYRRALEIRSDFNNAAGEAYFCASQVCDWTLRKTDEAHLRMLVRQGERDVSPFVLLSMGDAGDGDDARLQLQSGRLCAENDYQVHAMPRLVDEGQHPQRDRLRIGYLSADFHEHATMHLLRGVLNSHDKGKFLIHGYSCGTSVDAMTRQAAETCEVFRDVRELSNHEVAELIAADGIDILIDLKGYTQNTRLEITALRPAPVVVSWLGYPGTLGHPRLADYIVGDPIVTPPAHAAHFSETLALLPDCYQPNDRERTIGIQPSRGKAGLPETGFVFCCFNHSYKFNPETFEVWCRLLKAVPESVLWLLEPTDPAMTNLRNAAKAQGVEADRLVFAPMRPLTDHLGRLQLADLALDTFPYNSHTTASDALWAGVPLVTRIGKTFASRVSASLLSAIGLPELVTKSNEEYFTLTKTLALTPGRLAQIRKTLMNNRLTLPLFDTQRFTRNLERVYTKIWEQHEKNMKEMIVLSDD